MAPPSTSQFAEVARPLTPEPPVEPRQVEKGVVAFDVDGTILDDIGLISRVAGDVLERAFGTPAAEGRLHYLATTGLPFEAQLAQLYPSATPAERTAAAAIFHNRKIQEAYATAHPFPEVPRLLRRLSAAGWTLVVSTGAEREMADLVLEREGIRYWFEGLLGSAQGTKREHLAEYRRRYPGVPVFLVGDSRFDMEAASGQPGVIALGRASSVPGWTLTPADLRAWGARWADYSLAGLPDVLARLTAPAPARARRPKGRRGRDRDSPKAGVGPASL
jgi:phosphoglycolate phosphatase-like HAD superfamily hydrolase